MKKKFEIVIHGSGCLNDAIVRILTNHAEGRIEADFDLLESHAKADFANWPTIRPVYELKRNVNEGSLDVYEGDKHTMTIFEKHCFELQKTEFEDHNDLKDINI